MAKIKNLKDISGDIICPKTVASAVVYDENRNVSTLMSNSLYLGEENVPMEEIDPIDADTLNGNNSDYFASKQDLNTEKNILNNRIDNIITNSSETGSNTELIDIRTGTDGTVYSSAGTAVREQISELSEAIGEHQNEINVLNEGGLKLKDEFISRQVTDWLNDHPEASTTVQKHSLTIDKMVVGTLGYVTPEMFGAKGDGETDDTEAIKNALANGRIVWFGAKTYLMKERMVLSEHILYGTASSDSWGSKKTTIMFKDIPNDVESCVYVDFTSEINNIAFIYAEWDNNTRDIDGLRCKRKLVANRCTWNKFPGNGVNLFYGDGAPYYSAFNDCGFNFNRRHGIVIGEGCNCVNFANPQVSWNGSTVYGSGPTDLGEYDGIYIDDGRSLDEHINNFSNVIIGGDFSYNSRYGIYYKRASLLTQIGGYAELNKNLDYNIEGLYSSTLLNLYSSNTKVNVNVKFYTAGSNIWGNPNRIVINGKDYGSGIKVSDTGVYQYAQIATPTITRTGLLIRPEDDTIDFSYYPTGAGKKEYHLNFSEDIVIDTKNLSSENHYTKTESDEKYQLKSEAVTSGKTPVKGVDYFTEADKNIIVSEVYDMIKSGGVVGFVDENNNIILNGDLAEENYTVKYMMEDGSTVDIGNLIC